MEAETGVVPSNHLFQALAPSDREWLDRESVVTALGHMKTLYSDGEAIDAVYFPLDCVVSILVGSDENERVEMATVGREGAVGVFATMRIRKAMGDNVVQVAGEAMQLDIAKYASRVRESESFSELMHRYLYVLTRQIVQAGACNRIHTMEERCARWLLMMHDRLGEKGATFPLTQEFLAEMLGVRRATVALALGMFQGAGFIDYVRGQIKVLDRDGLHSASCSCYDIIRREYDNLRLQPDS